jgi:hypothetical protein
MRAFTINAKARQIVEAELPEANQLQAMQAAVGGMIEPAYEFENGDTVYVNEEGLFGDRSHWFEVEDAHQPFVGNAIVCGFDPETGETIDAKSTLDEVKRAVTFKTYAEVRAKVLDTVDGD